MVLSEAPVQTVRAPARAAEPILRIRGVRKAYGGLVAVDDCSFDIERGAITALVGPNGAGKTTLLELISGFQRLDRGQVYLGDALISNQGTSAPFRHGLVRTFQVPRPIPSMSVLENLVLAGRRQLGERVWNAWFRPSLVGHQENEIIDRALWALDYVDLGHLRDESAAVLSGGQKKLLEFARTLMIDAQVVLLDEPAAGVNRTLMNRLSERIEDQCRNYGVTYLIVEHDMEIVGRLADRVVVMSQGAPIFEGDFAAMQNDPQVLEAYLGSQFR